MTGNRNKFSNLKLFDGGNVKFGDKSKGKIVAIGTIKVSLSLSINDVLLVKGLKYNLLSISQFSDKGYKVIFDSDICSIEKKDTNQVVLTGKRNQNVYTCNLNNTVPSIKCFVASEQSTTLWHRRLGHINIDLISKVARKELVRGLPKLSWKDEGKCEACANGKQTRSSFKSKKHVSTSRPLEMLHMDLFGPTRTESLGGKLYAYVIIDDFTRFTWVLFLRHKNDAFIEFEKLALKLQNEKGMSIACIRSDHTREFDFEGFEKFCDQHGIYHDFSAPRTPQQNGVAERKNRTLIDLARTMLNEHNTAKHFLA